MPKYVWVEKLNEVNSVCSLCILQWETDCSECFYETGRLINGEFIIDFNLDDYEVKAYEELKSDYKITHWAQIDHPSDYD